MGTCSGGGRGLVGVNWGGVVVVGVSEDKYPAVVVGLVGIVMVVVSGVSGG